MVVARQTSGYRTPPIQMRQGLKYALGWKRPWSHGSDRRAAEDRQSLLRIGSTAWIIYTKEDLFHRAGLGKKLRAIKIKTKR